MRVLCAALFSSMLFAACRDTGVPQPGAAPAPGTLQGTVVYAIPGRSGYTPAARATVQLLGTGVSASAGDDGHFRLSNIATTTGTLLFTFDAPGQVRRQRVMRVEDTEAGPGRDIVLGQVILSRNALVRGRVRLEDSTGAGGLGGITAYVPAGPWSVLTADDGSYAIEALPEGELQVAFFRAGYEVTSLDVALKPGDERQLPDVQLAKSTDAPASVKGKLSPADGATVRLRRPGMEEMVPVTAGTGEFQKAGLGAGIYSFALERQGSLSIALYNVLLAPGETDLGTFNFIAGDSQTIDLGEVEPVVPDGGVGDGGTTTDGGMTEDGGVAPHAVASGPALATAGSMVTVTGMSSTGEFPLVYRWKQTAGTGVTLSANDTPLAHSPRFTAPAAGTVVELELRVEDRLGVTSPPAVVRVPIGGKPVARFTPDSGTVLQGQQAVPLTSTSFDDAGVVLAAYDWRLTSGTSGTLVTDGGPSAIWVTPAVAFGAPDVLGGVTLQVTNGIGVRSDLASNVYTVRGTAPNNWSVDAGPPQVVSVGASPPQVVLSGAVTSQVVLSPQYTVAWQCTPPLTLLGPDTLSPRFVAPVIVGPSKSFTCTLTATGQPPLDPPNVSGAVNLTLRDAAPATVVSTNIESTRVGRFGVLLHASEPLTVASLAANCNPALAYGMTTRVLFNSAIAGTTYVVFQEDQSCTSYVADLTDGAQFNNVSNNVPFGNPVTVNALWTGPYVSTATYADPRPVIATLSQVPREAQAAAGVTVGATPGYELVAADNGALQRLGGLDLDQRPTCDPSCPLTASQVLTGLPGGPLPTTRRAQFAGAELFVSLATDGGVAPAAARRSGSGTWSVFNGMAGSPDQWGIDLRAARFDAASGNLLLADWSPALQQFTTSDVIASGLTEVGVVATANNIAAAAVGPTRALLVRRRNPTDLTWSTFSPSTVHTNVSSMRWEVMASGLTILTLESNATNALTMVRADYAGTQTISTAAVTGYDTASWGGNIYVVYAVSGDVRLKTVAGSVWSGAGGVPVDFSAPPRPGFSPPYPVVLDADPTCEAAWPTMAFIEDALVITWQERCAPQTRWNVVSRVVR